MGFRLIIGFLSAWLLPYVVVVAQLGAPLPASVRWRQMETQHFRVVYNVGVADKYASHVARGLERVHGPVAEIWETVPGKRKKFNVVLNGKNALPNGYVALAPFRSEFFIHSPQDLFLGNTLWIDGLIVHEYRHVAQMNRVRHNRKSLFSYSYWLGGDFYAAMSFLLVPNWAWEGDAVVAESIFTQSGRGNTPGFLMQEKANLLTYGVFPYGRRRMGRYRYNIPSHYEHGYILTSFMKKKYGKDFVPHMFHPLFLPNYSLRSRARTGRWNSLSSDHGLAMHALRSRYVDQVGEAAETFTSFQILAPQEEPKRYTAYRYPVPLSTGEVLCLRSGLNDFSSFVLISSDGKEERRLHVPGLAGADLGYLSVGGNRWAWNELYFNGRWASIASRGVKVGDVRTGKVWRVTPKRGKYSGSGLSSDGQKVVVIHYLESGGQQLVLLSAREGKELKRFKEAWLYAYSTPVFAVQDTKILVKGVSAEQRSEIRLIDIETEKEELLLRGQDGREILSTPLMHDDYLIYVSTYSGIDNIYAMHLASRKQYRVVSAKYGALNPQISPDGSTLFYAHFTANGHRIAKTPFAPDTWQPLSEVKVHYVVPHEGLSAQEGHPELLLADADEEPPLPAKPYSRLGHLFSFHSWGLSPSPQDVLNLSIPFSLALSSTNLLGTMNSSAGMAISQNASQGGLNFGPFQGAFDFSPFVSATYKGFYPELTATVLYDSLRYHTRSAPNMGLLLGASVPYFFLRGRYAHNASVGLTAAAKGLNLAPRYRGYAFSAPLLWSRSYVNNAPRQVNNRWQQLVFLRPTYEPGRGREAPLSLTSTVQLYFPSLHKLHSAWFSAESQFLLGGKEGLAIHQLREIRGFQGRAPYYARRHQTVIRSNYSFPIWDIDQSLWFLAYLQRFVGNVFFDYGFNMDNRGVRDILATQIRRQRLASSLYDAYSYGAELKLEWNLFRFDMPIFLGAGLAMRSDGQLVRFYTLQL